MSCLALVNMSVSESFGIVLLEAWLAGRPVVVNKSCAAFHDMAVDGENALMVDESGLPAAIRRLAEDENFARTLAERGRNVTARFDWAAVSAEFVGICREAARGDRVAEA
jgi:glycosyltransferase involved in cell wall biosynthesis